MCMCVNKRRINRTTMNDGADQWCKYFNSCALEFRVALTFVVEMVRLLFREFGENILLCLGFLFSSDRDDEFYCPI